MRTLEWNDSALRAGSLDKPVRVHQPRGWGGLGSHYTAIPLDMLDSVRALLKACGYKLTTYYVGLRPADHWLDRHRGSRKWSVVAGTTRREHARYAKILVEDRRTGEHHYL
jgi:hypothetical protein